MPLESWSATETQCMLVTPRTRTHHATKRTHSATAEAQSAFSQSMLWGKQGAGHTSRGLLLHTEQARGALESSQNLPFARGYCHHHTTMPRLHPPHHTTPLRGGVCAHFCRPQWTTTSQPQTVNGCALACPQHRHTHTHRAHPNTYTQHINTQSHTHWLSIVTEGVQLLFLPRCTKLHQIGSNAKQKPAAYSLGASH